MTLEDDISNVRADVDEVKRLLNDCKRPKVTDFLTVELRRLETRLSDLIKKQEEAKEAAPKADKAPTAAAAEKKAYDFQLKNYSWDQSDKFVKIYLTSDLKNVQTLPADQFEFAAKSSSVHFVAKNLNGRNCVFDVKELAYKIDPEKSEYKVKSDMVVLMLKKYETEKWAHLKMSDMQASDKPKFKPPADVDKDADPSASLMSMMKQMYEEGDDDMKRTIAKAWSESRNSSSPVL